MSRFPKSYLLPLIVPLLAGLSLVLTLSYVTNTTIGVFERNENESRNFQTAALIGLEVDRLEQASSGVIALWNSSEFVSESEFLSFTETTKQYLSGISSLRWFSTDGQLVYENGIDSDRWNDLPSKTRDYLIDVIKQSSEKKTAVASLPFKNTDGVTVILLAIPGYNGNQPIGFSAITIKLSSLTGPATQLLNKKGISAILVTNVVAVSLNEDTLCLLDPDNRTPIDYDLCTNDMKADMASWTNSGLSVDDISDWSLVSEPLLIETRWMMSTFHLFGTIVSLLVAFLWASLKADRRKTKIAAEREKSFVSLVSHQLREPLTQLSWGFDALADDDELDKVHNDQINELRLMLRRATKMVSDLLNISRLERGVLSMDLEEISLTTIIDDSLYALKAVIEERESSILNDVSTGFLVYADRVKTGEAIRNIIDNAIKYGPRGGLIELKATTEDNMTELLITDHGPGIPSEMQDTIFDKNSAFRRQVDRKSTGLGLFLSKMFIEAQGGSISFESSHLGTVFRIKLPTKMPSDKR